MNTGTFVVELGAAIVKKIRSRPKAVARRAARAARKAKRENPLDETAEEFNQQREDRSMDSLRGALTSKLIWLGVGQVVYGLFQLWASGDLSADTAGPVLSGALTIVLRAMTDQSLAEKSK